MLIVLIIICGIITIISLIGIIALLVFGRPSSVKKPKKTASSTYRANYMASELARAIASKLIKESALGSSGNIDQLSATINDVLCSAIDQKQNATKAKGSEQDNPIVTGTL